MCEPHKSLNHFLATISIPFENQRHANIVAKSLLVDLQHESVRMSSGIRKEILNENNELIIKFSTNSPKSLRVNVNSILDAVILLIDTIDNFDLPTTSVTPEQSQS